MSRLARIDSWIIQQILEPYLWWIETKIGLKNFATSRIILLGYPVCAYVYFASYSEDTLEILIERMFVAIGVSAVIFWYSYDVEKRSTEAKHNPLRDQPLLKFIRSGYFIFCVLFNFAADFSMLAISVDALMIAMFAICCNPKPPSVAGPNV